jgi:hypothetical protein
MCFACEQEDLYFLYLERLEQARQAAFGEHRAPNPNWLWPGASATPAPRPEPKAAPKSAAKSAAKNAFVCDTPE